MMDDNATTATVASTIPSASLRSSFTNNSNNRTTNRTARNNPTTQLQHDVDTTSMDSRINNKGYAHEFIVNQPISRVYRNLKHTDNWMPFFFTVGYDGKRTEGSHQGEVGCAYKATYYEITTSFAKDYVERFEIIKWQKPKPNFTTAENNNIGEIVISHRPNARSAKGWKEIYIQFIPLEDDITKTMVSIGYPTNVRKYKLSTFIFGFGLFFNNNNNNNYSIPYQYRLDSTNDLKRYLSI